ncbi:hypothetical protein PHYPSEUDO_000469 [Phytophthora pseudosyringae]|uniref:GPI inositol-deacylase n=1 Tax=Phytophthora pseudosyringae TaxID=221518 RepID=A0A8T1VYA2_9STRA|nr:hypothetical protein PHYPSEUDO_000469 [Phytophthora pseudosyringae]
MEPFTVILFALLAVAVSASEVGTEQRREAASTTAHRLEPSLHDAPSLKLHVTLKRESMKIHGQSKFDIFANPVVAGTGSSVLYDGYAAFIEGDAQVTYAHVNGVGYLVNQGLNSGQTVKCLPSESLASDAILAALNAAAAIPSASIGNEKIDCDGGELFQTTLGGAGFALCALGSAGFSMSSSDLAVDVEYLAQPVDIPVPTSPIACETVATATSVTPTALAFITGTGIPSTTSRSLEQASHMAMAASTCACKSTPRPCVFFHGSGNKNEEKELQDTPKKLSHKFGDIRGHAPCCSSMKYAVLNTVDYGWMSDALQQKYCDHILSLSSTSDEASGVIEDTIVVTHSMGGLVMAGALTTGKCSLGQGSSWVGLSPPMNGSMASDYLEDYCSGEFTDIAGGLLGLIGTCPTSIARLSTVYEKEKYSTTRLNKAYTAAQDAYRTNVTAAICSNSYVGIFSEYQAASIVGGTAIPHKSSKNDGLVEFQSCLGGLDVSKFGSSYTDQFYMPELNHADTAFLAGDGLLKDSQKPVKWFECLL